MNSLCQRASLLTLFIVCLLSSSTLFAQGLDQPTSPLPQFKEQEYTVMGISVEGNKSGSSETIISQSGLYKGEKFTVPSDAIRRGIQQLWSQGLYSDVRVEIEREVKQTDGSTGVFLVIKVRELPKLGAISVSGNDHLKTADIEKAAGLKQFDFVRPWQLAEAKNRVKALYEKEGYHFADVELQQSNTSDTATLTNVTIAVREGSEVVVRNINFIGNSKISESDLRGAMDETKEKRWWKIFSSGSFDEKKYQEDKQRVIDYYHSKGFRDAYIIGDSIWLTNKEDLNIRIDISEGPQYRVRNITTAGNQVFTDEEIRQHLGFRKGDIYDIPKFDMNMRGPTADFNDVGSLYYDRGYVVNIGKEENVVPGDSVDIVLRVQEGKQHFFRYVDIQGNSKTKDYVIRRELYTRPGDPFSRSAIIRSIRQISQLNYFNQEKLTPDVKIAPDATDVDVTFNVEERSSDTFNASVGYGGSLGFTGSVGLSFNNFDIADPLHGGAGQVLSITAEFGQQNYRTLALSFSEPWLWQTPTALGFSIYQQHQAYVYTYDRTGASLSLGRRFRWPDDFFRGDWTLSGQHQDIENGGGIYTIGKHDEMSIQQVLSRISTDNPVFPTSGSEFSLLNRLAFLPITSIFPNEPANYFKNQFTMRFYTPLVAYGGSNKLVFMTSAEIGQLGGLGKTPYVPPTERFTMGGSGLATGFYTIALRGYNDASIGIQRSQNASIAEGGLAYSKYALESRFIVSLEPIPIYFLAFAEAGNVWKDFSHADPFTLKRSLGLGARIQVPAVGLIGIDFGYGFDPEGTFGPPSGWHTHFQFGRGF